MDATSPEYPTLDLSFIRQQLAQSAVGHTIAYHRSIPSTMPIAGALAQQTDTPSGLVVVAEEQTAGRGRRGRRWQAPYASALLVSVILKPPHCQLPAATLTMVAANALLSAVAMTLPPLENELHFKWPNDLVVGSDPARARKLGGILAESTLNGDGSIRYAILGIGLNVNQPASALPRIAPPTPRATSLRLAAAKKAAQEGDDKVASPSNDRIIDRSSIFVHLCRQLAAGLALAPAQSYRMWKQRLATLGQSVTIYPHGVEEAPTFTGQALDVAEDGALVVVDEQGATHHFHAADISIRVTP